MTIYKAGRYENNISQLLQGEEGRYFTIMTREDVEEKLTFLVSITLLDGKWAVGETGTAEWKQSLKNEQPPKTIQSNICDEGERYIKLNLGDKCDQDMVCTAHGVAKNGKMRNEKQRRRDCTSPAPAFSFSTSDSTELYDKSTRLYA